MEKSYCEIIDDIDDEVSSISSVIENINGLATCLGRCVDDMHDDISYCKDKYPYLAECERLIYSLNACIVDITSKLVLRMDSVSNRLFNVNSFLKLEPGIRTLNNNVKEEK